MNSLTKCFACLENTVIKMLFCYDVIRGSESLCIPRDPITKESVEIYILCFAICRTHIISDLQVRLFITQLRYYELWRPPFSSQVGDNGIRQDCIVPTKYLDITMYMHALP